MEKRRATELVKIASNLFDEAKCDLEQIRAKRAALESRVSELNDAALQTGSHAYQSVCADVKWRSWIDRKRSQMLSELAFARAEELLSMKLAHKALAKREAISLLVSRQKDEAAERRVRAMGKQTSMEMLLNQLGAQGPR